MPSSGRGGKDLLEYFSVVRARKWLVFAVTIVVVASALILSFRQTPTYQANARLLIQPDNSILGTGQQTVPVDYVTTQMQVIESQPVQSMVRARLGSTPSVTTNMVGTTSVVQVSARSTSAKRAAETANAYVDAYVGYRQKVAGDALGAATNDLQGRIDDLQKQIDALASRLAAIPACTNLPGSAAACSQRTSVQQDRDSLLARQVPLKQQLDQIQLNSPVRTSGVQIVTNAVLPENPVSPTPIRNGLLALGLGLVFGVALVLLFEYLDDSIKGADDLKRIDRDLTVLGLIPSAQGWRHKQKPRVVALSEPASSSAEAYRTLRTSIRFLGLDPQLRIIQITSPGAGEGKTTTAANLAVVLARSGERVVVVSCDLRRPRLHDFFGLPNTIGFTSVLLGESSLVDALHRVDADGVLWVLASGPIPPNPSELLQSKRANQLFAALRNYADIIVIDCPPVLPVTDAAVLSAKVDGTLLVLSAGKSTTKQAARAAEVLHQVSAPLVGAVLNNMPDIGGYGYRYGEHSTPPATDSASGNGKNLNGGTTVEAMESLAHEQ